MYPVVAVNPMTWKEKRKKNTPISKILFISKHPTDYTSHRFAGLLFIIDTVWFFFFFVVFYFWHDSHD